MELRRFLFVFLRFFPGFLRLTSKLVSEFNTILIFGNPSLRKPNEAIDISTIRTGHGIRQLIQKDLVQSQLLICRILPWILHRLKSIYHFSMLKLQVSLEDPIFAKLYLSQHSWRLPGTRSHLVPARLYAIISYLPICKRCEYAATHKIVHAVHTSTVAPCSVGALIHGGVLCTRHAISR